MTWLPWILLVAVIVISYVGLPILMRDRMAASLTVDLQHGSNKYQLKRDSYAFWFRGSGDWRRIDPAKIREGLTVEDLCGLSGVPLRGNWRKEGF